MSLSANNIISPNLIALQNTVLSQSSQIQKLIDLYSDKNKPSFDHTTKQNVVISYDTVNNKYRFEIQKPENNIFMYQVWKKGNDTMNSSRKYFDSPLKDWINTYNQVKNFTPTTLIEINNGFYPAVMVDAKIENTYCIFYFTTKEISSVEQNTSIPKTGSYSNVRFDIDDSTDEMYYTGYDYPYRSDHSLWGQKVCLFIAIGNEIDVIIGTDGKIYLDSDVFVVTYINNGDNVSMRFYNSQGATSLLTF